MNDQIEVVKRAVLAELGPLEDWATPAGYPDSLALCVIDSIQSIGQKYGGVRHVVRRYSDYREAQGGDATRDGASQLSTTFRELGGVEVWATRLGTNNRVYANLDAPLKAAAIHDAAELLIARGVLDTAALRKLTTEDLEPLKLAWMYELPSQRSGLSWRYLLMLAGMEDVKPDRMITRFLAAHLATDRRLSVDEAAKLVVEVASQLDVSPRTLDHRIWLHQRSQLGARPASDGGAEQDHEG